MDSTPDKPDDFLDHPVAARSGRMSYDVQDPDDWRLVLAHPGMVAALRLIKLVVRGVVFFAFSFIEIIAEVLAPILLLCGIVWSVLPNILSMAPADGQARDMINTVVQAIPQELHVGRTIITPSALILDGLLLIALVALCRTIQAMVSTEA